VTGSKTIVLVRHTDNDGDVLTPQGVADAVAVEQTLDGAFTVAASSGAQRASQTVGCLLSGLGQAVPGGVVVIEALRSLLAMLPDGGRALAVGHSPTNEAAVLGLTGQ
jgi:broad specificity phosphatase PhoE